MSDPSFTIIATGPIPEHRIPAMPGYVSFQIIPFTKIIPRQAKDILAFIQKNSEKKNTVVFTSAYAAQYVSNLLHNKPEWNIYCLRNETRRTVEERFGNDAIHYAENAQALAEKMIKDKVPSAIFFCGDQRMNTLPDLLKKNAVHLEEMIVYDTVPSPRQLEEIPGALLFFSPAAVKSFFSCNELDPATRLFTMGTTTAAELKNFTATQPVVSPKADKIHILNMALEYAASHLIL